jgi:hypothetical protein
MTEDAGALSPGRTSPLFISSSNLQTALSGLASTYR